MTAAERFVCAGLWCTAVVALTAWPDARSDAAVTDDRAASVGCWDVIAVEWNGRPMDPEILSLLQVAFRADGSWSVLFKNLPVIAGRSTNRQDETPKTFEMETLGSEGIEPSRYTGIYRLDGDTREFCFAPEGTPRPAEFSAPRHSGRMLVTLARPRKPAVETQRAAVSADYSCPP
mgnify:CR=1 FL=1